MAWDTRPIERELEKRLKSGDDDITEIEGIDLFSSYTQARKRVLEEILPEIKAIEADLTDHGDRHIANVLDNIYALIGKDSNRVSVMELYFLCITALFHDVGNIHGREGHYDKAVIYKIYSYIRGDDPKFDEEKNLVADAASKHSGLASDNTYDTINELPDTEVGFWNRGINLRKCAAILRLADELAEGQQRTSNFMLLTHKYSPESELYHQYALCKKVNISRSQGRISITYNFKVSTDKVDVWNELERLLDYVHKRIIKLNDERLYNKYYAEVLSDFKQVEVTMNFEIDKEPIAMGLKQLVINDLGQLGAIKAVSTFDEAYAVNMIINKLKATCNAKEPTQGN